MEEESWVSISFPYQITSLPGWYENWEYQMTVWLMTWEWYGELPSIYHLHSRESGNIWYWYGAEPYHSHAIYCGECMGCYQIRSNPIVKIYWTIYWWRLLTHMGLICHVVSHTNSIYYPCQGHGSCHTTSILGPYMAHVIMFGKGHSNSYANSIKHLFSNNPIAHFELLISEPIRTLNSLPTLGQQATNT